MSQYQLSRQRILYTTDTVTVHQGVLHPHNLPVAIKESIHQSVSAANLALREGFAMRGLIHPHICTVYDCYIEEGEGTGVRTVLVVELMDSDLAQETEKRRIAGTTWTDYELYYILQSLVSALSYAEQRGISHRDIKPQNIFYSQGVVKVGDFGAATVLKQDSLMYSLQGSPLYLSPELKRGYIEMLTTGERNVQYDPIKSDVYSLGLTLLHLAQLSPPSQLSVLSTLGPDTQSVLSSLSQYPYLQFFLTYMLSVYEPARPTFLTLMAWFNQIETTVVEEPAIDTDPREAQDVLLEAEAISEGSADSQRAEVGQRASCAVGKRLNSCRLKQFRKSFAEEVKKNVEKMKQSALSFMKNAFGLLSPRN